MRTRTRKEEEERGKRRRKELLGGTRKKNTIIWGCRVNYILRDEAETKEIAFLMSCPEKQL